MSIYVLEWIKEDLLLNGDDIKNYTLIQLKTIMKKYNEKYNR